MTGLSAERAGPSGEWARPSGPTGPPADVAVGMVKSGWWRLIDAGPAA